MLQEMGCQHVEGHNVVIMSSCGVIMVKSYIFLSLSLWLCMYKFVGWIRWDMARSCLFCGHV